MKKYTVAVLALAATTLTAIIAPITQARAQILKNNSDPEIFIINQPGGIDTMSINRIVELYHSTQREGFGHLGMPGFVITGASQNILLGLGGNVSIRTSDDFDGISDDYDFKTSYIPVPNSPAKEQKFLVDPSTTGLFFKGIVNSERFGPIEAYIEANFRGYNKSDFFLRKAYVAIGGFMVGRYYTTFYDTRSTASVIDFEGPNNLSLTYRTQLRYVQRIGRRFSVGAALEGPVISATPGSTFAIPDQRIPDIPAFVEYDWGKGHLRISGLFREMVYMNTSTEQMNYKTGWGASFTGSIALGPKMTSYFGATYGEGIAAYIQDLGGHGLDLITDSRDPQRLQTLAVAGWNGGLQYVFNSEWTATATYSGVKIFPQEGYSEPSSYNLAHYVSVNAFHHLTDNCQVGLSYLYGSRKDLDSQTGHANRIQGIIQYNF